MSDAHTPRRVDLKRIDRDHYQVTNERGGSLIAGTDGAGVFTPSELLLASIASCTAIDVDYMVSRRADLDMALTVSGERIRDEAGNNRLVNLRVEFTASLPPGPEGEVARSFLPKAVQMSHDRICVVSRTVELGTPIESAVVEIQDLAPGAPAAPEDE